ncbi:MAG: hypothetical protein LBG28_09530 [Tannerella sp.]|jgi:hypothetical protein|nr:hypothetical protein [Tannerella sp.]
MSKYKFLMISALLLLGIMSYSCSESDPEPPVVILEYPPFNESIDLNGSESVLFKWVNVEGVTSYNLVLSLSTYAGGDRQVIPATTNPLAVPAEVLKEKAIALGCEASKITTVYWTIVPVDGNATTQVRSIQIIFY